MAEDFGFSELVTQAKLGNRESMDRLVQLAEPRLCAYIYRTTLDKGLTDDAVQETLLAMVKSLKDLQKTESFWPWLFQVASSKTNQLLRTVKRTSAAQFSTLEDSLLESILRDDSQEAVSSLIRRELAQLIVKATAGLKHRQRAVVALRCFEGMSYAEVAQAVGCKEREARISFFRAKQSLKKQLSRRGFSKSSLLLALILFGKLTAPTEAAAVSVTVAPGMLTGIGILAKLFGLAKSHLAKISAAALLLVAIACWHFWPESVLNRADVRSVHFTVQSVESSLDSSSSSSSSSGSPISTDRDGEPLRTRAFYETWLYFPQGPDGPVFKREQRWGNIEQTEEECSWLQDGKANYYYRHRVQMPLDERAIHVTNDPLWALLLPTDAPDFADFILEMCGRHPSLAYIRDEKTGLLTGRIDNRVPTVKNFKTTYEYNKLDEKFLEYNWPEEVKVVDKRDAMHKRGWTYFQITGQIGNKDISGRGRIPFVYAAYKEHSPWLQLRISDGLSIVDSSGGAYLLDGFGTVQAHYPAGSFFKGLGRPWMGIRAYDSVRRDAAEKRIRFEYERLDEGGWVTLLRDEDYSHTRAVYFIDMEKDIIESISFSISSGAELIEGSLKFSYLDEVRDVGDEFAEPGPMDCELPVRQAAGVLWLLQLAEGTLGEF